MTLLPYNGFVVFMLATTFFSALGCYFFPARSGLVALDFLLGIASLVEFFGAMACPIFVFLYTVQMLISLFQGQRRQALLSLLWVLLSTISLAATLLLNPRFLYLA
jgi:hypothetical protein